MKPAFTVGSHSKSLAYDPVFEPMLAFMNRCKHFVIQKIALPCLDKAITEKQQDPSPFETMLGMNPWNTVAFQDPPFDDFLFFYLGVVFEDAAPAVILE